MRAEHRHAVCYLTAYRLGDIIVLPVAVGCGYGVELYVEEARRRDADEMRGRCRCGSVARWSLRGGALSAWERPS